MSNNKDLPAHIELLTVGEEINPMLPSAVFQVDSKKGALVVSRLTQKEIDALTPWEGMVLYNLDELTLQVRQGRAWVSFSDRGVTFVDTGTGLKGGPITSKGSISLEDTGVVSGTYYNPSMTVDSTGRIMNIKDGTSPQSSTCFLEAILSQDQTIDTHSIVPLNFDRALTNKNYAGNPFRSANQIVLPYKGLYHLNTIVTFKTDNTSYDDGWVQLSFNLLDSMGRSTIRTNLLQKSFVQSIDNLYPNFSGCSLLFYNEEPNQSVQICIQSQIDTPVIVEHDPYLTIAQISGVSIENYCGHNNFD